jgi:cytochrome P450
MALRGPTAFFERARARHGDTYAVDGFGFRLLMVFSPAGVRRLYELPEREASFGLATYRMISHKAPAELFDGRRVTPHDLFANSELEGYLDELRAAMATEISVLGPSGRFDVFAECRRLAHRLGLSAWAGEAGESRYLDRLRPAFDRLDTAESFVHPTQMIRTWATRKRGEQAAMVEIESVLTEILNRRETAGEWPDDWLTRIWEAHDDRPPGERRTHVARDVIVIHLGSMSNLYAAMGWTLVEVLRQPGLREAVLAGDDELLERAASESIRMAQRSITLREVMTPIEVDDGSITYRLEPGVLLATMLSVTNTTACPALQTFDPGHYVGRRLAGSVEVPTKELVSTFGHGRHSCPAARFSISAIRIAVRALIETYDLTGELESLQPLQGQLGGVARGDRPAWLNYSRRYP